MFAIEGRWVRKCATLFIYSFVDFQRFLTAQPISNSPSSPPENTKDIMIPLSHSTCVHKEFKPVSALQQRTSRDPYVVSYMFSELIYLASSGLI